MCSPGWIITSSVSRAIGQQSGLVRSSCSEPRTVERRTVAACNASSQSQEPREAAVAEAAASSTTTITITRCYIYKCIGLAETNPEKHKESDGKLDFADVYRHDISRGTDSVAPDSLTRLAIIAKTTTQTTITSSKLNMNTSNTGEKL